MSETTTASVAVAPSTAWAWAPPTRREWTGLAVACLFVVVVGTLLVMHGSPLGHDESVYALRARFWAGDGAEVAWNAYRAEGLPFLSAPLVWFGGGDAALRMVVLGFGVAMVVLTWALARLWFGPRAGLLAAAIVAVTPATMTYGWQIALDVPSTALGLAAALILAMALRGERLRWLALWAVPLAVAATYVRYGAPLVVASGMTAVAAARWRVVLRSWGRTLVVAAATVAGMAVVLLVPAVTASNRSPGLAFRARQVAKEIGAFESYGDFVSVLDNVFGLVVGVIVIVGLLLLAARWQRVPAASLVAVLGGAALFVVGLNFSLAQVFAQYVVPLVPYAAIAAGAGLATVAGGQRAAVVAALGIMVLGAAPSWRAGTATVERADRSYGVIRTVGRELDATTDGACVVLTSYSPQIGWYSRCPAYAFSSPYREGHLDREDLLAGAGPFLDPAEDRTGAYVVLIYRGKRQPDDVGVTDILDLAVSVVEIGDSDEGPRRSGRIIELEPVS